MIRSFFSRHRAELIFAGTALAAFALVLAFRIPCPIKHVTGLSCAGCGMTRACLSVLSADLSAAFEYHPLWITLPPLAVLISALGKKRRRRALNAVLISAAVLFFGVWIFRLVAGDGIVRFDFENSAINKIITKITEIS